MRTGRSTEAEFNRRIEVIIPLLVMGLSRREIIQFVATKTDPPWKISLRSIDRLALEARKVIAEAAQTTVEEELGLGVMRLEDLYKRSLSIQDYKAALSVQKERHELLGIKKQRNDVNVYISTWDDLEREAGKSGTGKPGARKAAEEDDPTEDDTDG